MMNHKIPYREYLISVGAIRPRINSAVRTETHSPAQLKLDDTARAMIAAGVSLDMQEYFYGLRF
jgi:hypothetical protein